LAIPTVGDLGRLPIYYASDQSKDIRGFRTVFEVGIRHIPTEIGLLFLKEKYGNKPPYRVACGKYGNEKVNKLVHDILNIDIQPNGGGGGVDIAKALVYVATIEKTVQPNGVYTLLRRQPSMLQAPAQQQGPR